MTAVNWADKKVWHSAALKVENWAASKACQLVVWRVVQKVAHSVACWDERWVVSRAA